MCFLVCFAVNKDYVFLFIYDISWNLLCTYPTPLSTICSLVVQVADKPRQNCIAQVPLVQFKFIPKFQCPV
jgi:hypothetical protein